MPFLNGNILCLMEGAPLPQKEKPTRRQKEINRKGKKKLRIPKIKGGSWVEDGRER